MNNLMFKTLLFNRNPVVAHFRFPRAKWLLSSVLAGVLLTGCGGGSDSGTSGNNAPVVNVNSQLFSYLPVTLTRLYSAKVTASGVSAGGRASHYVLASGSLPPGLTLSESTGVISGSPTQSGTFSAGLSLTIDGFTGSAPATFNATVIDPSLSLFAVYPAAQNSNGSGQYLLPGIAIKNQDVRLSFGFVQNQQNTLSPPTVQYEITGNIPLPPGLTLNSTTGVITGTPTIAGVWFVQVQATMVVQGVIYKLPFIAPISVGAVLPLSTGQVVAPFRIPVYSAPELTISTSAGRAAGLAASFAYDRASSTILVSPATIVAGARQGSYEGQSLVLSLASGEKAFAGFVGNINSALVVNY